ncbi:MAG: beta-Ig-H3/fasciclin [Balneola sp.]|mgnify:FL=1|jgi:transforming growth factor-beta-induced protein|nr:beta-Ig-H3/fasciclin [Balneola sp.]MBE79706.1 beta-Ig-H3/fasciclin [Balneola sp.]|tara:strand:+ start:120 stop:1046 length:927 start_codon:yes stop_codon:yes gene_type:complete
MKTNLSISRFTYLFTLILISSVTFFACSDDDGNAADDDLNIVETAQANDNFSILVDALVDAELDGALSGAGPFTVFAPTNEAFNALPSGLLESLTNEQLTEILQYHVLAAEVASTDLEASQAVATLTEETIFVTVENGSVTINNTADVVTADIETTNGVIHAIDGVMLPNKFQNIVEIASKNYELSTLVSLLVDADLVSTLEGDGPFTVFAPTNAAFEEVSATLATLTSEQVREVLTYHAVAAEALSSSLSDGMTVTTVQGEDITVNISGGNVTLNENANVTTVDLQGTNGVVHIIDAVLLPPSYSAE